MFFYGKWNYNLHPEEILVVDDLKPGFDMAKKVGVHFAWAGWSHHIPKLVSFMQKNADFLLYNVADLDSLIFQNQIET